MEVNVLQRISLVLVMSTLAGSSAFALNCDKPKNSDKAKCVAEAPEMNASSAIAALTLLAGGVAVLVGGRSRRLEPQAR
jgi:hypothetical protein